MLGGGHPITSPKGLVAWGAFFALIWGLFAALFLIDLFSDNALAFRGVETTGTVVAVQRAHGKGQRYQPIIEFRGANGLSYTFEGERVQQHQTGEIGEKVAVVYLSDDPDKAIINDTRTRFNSLFGFMATLPGLLIGLFVLGVNFLKLRDERETGQ